MMVDSEVEFKLGLLSKLTRLEIKLKLYPFCGSTICNSNT